MLSSTRENSLEVVSKDLNVSTKYLMRIINTSSRRYRAYEITGKSGKKRTVHQPSRKLKAVQRAIISCIFRDFPIHRCATAYMKGIGIRENAMRHQRNKFLLRLDINRFFESIKLDDVFKHLQKYAPQIDDACAASIAKVVCFHGSLVIGAPSSPMIANTIMFEIDTKISEYCDAIGVSYSRYADDLFFSTNERGLLRTVEEKVKTILSDTVSPRLFVNKQKTNHASKKKQRVVTGIVLNSKSEISLGRQRKRAIKSLVFSYINGNDGVDVSRICGMLSFAKHIEPRFYESLRKKYGESVIEEIVKNKKIA